MQFNPVVHGLWRRCAPSPAWPRYALHSHNVHTLHTTELQHDLVSLGTGNRNTGTHRLPGHGMPCTLTLFTPLNPNQLMDGLMHFNPISHRQLRRWALLPAWPLCASTEVATRLYC